MPNQIGLHQSMSMASGNSIGSFVSKIKKKKINRLSEQIIESVFFHNPEIMKKIVSEAALKGYASEEFVEEVVKIISNMEPAPASSPSE